VDRHARMTKLVAASHNFANMPKMSVCVENIFKEIHCHDSLEARKLYLFHCSHVASSSGSLVLKILITRIIDWIREIQNW